jgi:hypothetical protein
MKIINIKKCQVSNSNSAFFVIYFVAYVALALSRIDTPTHYPDLSISL